MQHTILTFIVRIRPERRAELGRLLDEIGARPADNPHIPFRQLEKLHFASITIFDDANFGDYLVFEHNFDGTLEPYLEDLYRVAAPGLHLLYTHCLDYNVREASDRAALLDYLRAHVRRPDAYHIGNTGRSVERIRREANLREQLQTFLDRHTANRSAAQPATVDAIRGEMQAFVRADASLRWAEATEARLSFTERVKPWAHVALVALIALLLAPILIPALIVYLIILRRRERRDPSVIEASTHAHVQRLAHREDNATQNHMANISPVKPGRFRRLTLRGVLRLTNLVARVMNRGTLSGLDSLHFAHWALIDDDRRLLFLTNYDGSWENYLDDFIDKAAAGLTGIWGNTVNFPRTRFLVFGGARDARRFKALARRNQVYTNVWYSAYENLTVRAVDANSRIREGLFAPLDTQAARRWLWRF